MSFDLDEYTPETMAEGDKLKPSDIVDHPLICKVLDYRTGLTTKYADGDGEAVVVDVFDMSDQSLHLGVMWFNNAIRDNLKNKVGKAMPIRLVYQAPKKPGGNAYIIPTALEGADLETARSWAKAKPTLFDDAREERGMGAYGSESPDPQPQSSQFDKPAATTPAAQPPAAQGPAASTPAPAAQPSAAAPAAADDEDIPF